MGFWDQLTGPKPAPSANQVANKPVSKPQNVPSGGPNPVNQQQQSKENKSKAKREEMAVMQLFGSQTRQDEFTQWCQQTLANLPTSCPLDSGFIYAFYTFA